MYVTNITDNIGSKLTNKSMQSWYTSKAYENIEHRMLGFEEKNVMYVIV